MVIPCTPNKVTSLQAGSSSAPSWHPPCFRELCFHTFSQSLCRSLLFVLAVTFEQKERLVPACQKNQDLPGSTPHRLRAVSARIYAHVEG